MLTLKYTSKFKKDYKLVKKRGLDISLLKYIINELANQRQLEQKYQDHPLSGNYDGFRVCHIQPDWLLLYLVDNNVHTLTLTRTGTHSDLFSK
jgi:mRNA interferase YafQ